MGANRRDGPLGRNPSPSSAESAANLVPNCETIEHRLPAVNIWLKLQVSEPAEAIVDVAGFLDVEGEFPRRMALAGADLPTSLEETGSGRSEQPAFLD